ncbi:MAG TPA: hypothetical protein VGY54_19985, partial [Polyangiaceae bacterium]|nr:hypothetical protein [Polyangiaceae bacterium]
TVGLWDPNTGAFPCGAVVAGLNDDPAISYMGFTNAYTSVLRDAPCRKTQTSLRNSSARSQMTLAPATHS